MSRQKLVKMKKSNGEANLRYGLVHLKAPVMAPNGKMHSTFRGKWEILKNDCLSGFVLCEDCNYLVKVYGESNLNCVYLFGCQVLNFVEFSKSAVIINNDVFDFI